MKAGISTRSSTSASSCFGCRLSLARSSKSFRSLSRTLARMNERNGEVMRRVGLRLLILFSISGCTPFCQAPSKVGAMT